MAGEKITGAQQENLLTLLAHDDTNGKLVARMVNPDLFEGDYREIATRLIAYWKNHSSAPKVHAADLFGDILDDDKNRRRKTFERILRNIDQLIDGLNTEYVMQTLRSFTRLQTMKDGILKAAEKLNAADETSVQEVEAMLGDLLRAREFNFDPGMTLLDIGQVMDYLDQHSSEFRMGIGPLDRANIVPARGAVFLMLGETGFGKTWGLVHTGKHGLLQRKRVLHITLEMAAEETAQRYYQSLFSVAKTRDPVQAAQLVLSNDKWQDLRRVGRRIEIIPDFSFADANIRKRLRAEVNPWKVRIPNLVIKRFPPRGLTIDGLRAYLDALEATTGFIPDMIILDYIGIMKTDASNHRITLGRVMEDFRGVCVERNCAGVTAAQVSKEGAKAKVVKATHVAEDWSLIATTDICITYTQSEAEKRLGLARVFVDKARSEADKFWFIMTQAYAIGQFCLQATRLDKTYEDYIKPFEQEEAEDEDANDRRRDRGDDGDD